MKAAATFDPSVAKFSTWATRIIRQHIINEIRKRRQDTVPLSSLDYDEAERVLVDYREDFPLHLAGLLVDPDPSDSKAEAENKRMLAMHHLDGQSLSDIGRKVGLSKERVRQRLANAIQSIRLKKREEIKEYMSI
jgi:RNA polymerase sigma factor (sigma-70 family)